MMYVSAPSHTIRGTQQWRPLQTRSPVCGSWVLTRRVRRGQHLTRAQGDRGEGPDSRIETLFEEELKRRGMDRASGSSMDDVETSAAQKDPPTTKTASKSPFDAGRPSGGPTAGPGAGTRGPLPPPPAEDGQRARSMALVSEGLEGLIPRATELLKLGGSIFLAFLPFMVAFSLTFSGLYLVFGEHLLHGGSSRSGPPAYVDPATLLSAPTVDPYIPYQ